MSSEYVDAFPSLSEADLALVQGRGGRRSIRAGEYLFRQGDQTNEFYVVLSGAIEIVVHSDGVDHVIVRHGPGRFVGELNLITGLRLFVSARVVESGEIVVVSQHDLRTLIATQPHLSDVILRARGSPNPLAQERRQSLRLVAASAHADAASANT